MSRKSSHQWQGLQSKLHEGPVTPHSIHGKSKERSDEGSTHWSAWRSEDRSVRDRAQSQVRGSDNGARRSTKDRQRGGQKGGCTRGGTSREGNGHGRDLANCEGGGLQDCPRRNQSYWERVWFGFWEETEYIGVWDDEEGIILPTRIRSGNTDTSGQNLQGKSNIHCQKRIRRKDFVIIWNARKAPTSAWDASNSRTTNKVKEGIEAHSGGSLGAGCQKGGRPYGLRGGCCYC